MHRSIREGGEPLALKREHVPHLAQCCLAVLVKHLNGLLEQTAVVPGPVPNGQRKSHLAVAPSRWVRCCSAGAEHVAVLARVIVRHEQFTGLPVSAASRLGVGKIIGGDHVA